MFLLVVLLVAIFAALLPIIAPRALHKLGITTQPAPLWLPILAAILFIAAPFFPDIHISPETQTFQWHFTGGVFTALLYLYLTRLIGWRPSSLPFLAGLYAWTSALGVANELFEFTITKLQVLPVDISDTGWDLVANTCGALSIYAIYCVTAKVRTT